MNKKEERAEILDLLEDLKKKSKCWVHHDLYVLGASANLEVIIKQKDRVYKIVWD